MKICTYNILEGGVGRVDPLAEVIRLSGAEVVVLQETWDGDLFHKLADRLAMDRFLATNPRNKEGGVGLLSKWTIREAVNWAPLDIRLTRSAFSARIGRSDEELALIGLHLHARESREDETIRLGELPAVLEIGRKLKMPHIICGDFNTSHPDQVIDTTKLRPKVRERVEKSGGSVPRDVIARMLAAGYLDTHAIGRKPEQFDVTLSTAHPGMRVDYVFVTKELVSSVKSCDVFKPEMARFASDHFPVVAEFYF
jgi:endonuclease/exonuclease/phosphatase family metal-dependent hydrolase